ncbi:MAG: hypothetical protein EOO61_16795 [Hymenobacter sp.]|nr:MAG: hypothetical protein EOO61_16795 [Hymenobacter sp.]
MAADIFSNDWNNERKLRWFFLNAIDSAIKDFASKSSRVGPSIEVPSLDYNAQVTLMDEYTESYAINDEMKLRNSVMTFNSMPLDQRNREFSIHIRESRINKQHINRLPNIEIDAQNELLEKLWIQYANDIARN